MVEGRESGLQNIVNCLEVSYCQSSDKHQVSTLALHPPTHPWPINKTKSVTSG